MQFLRLLLFLVLIMGISGATAQIGTHIPSNRLPEGSASLWKNAGCAFLEGTFLVTQFLDVKLMGAIGDSITNDTPIIQQAIELAEQAASTGGFTIIYFPAGFYRIIEQLDLPASTVIKGESSMLSTIYMDHYEDGILLSSSCEYTGIEDLCLKRNHEVIEQDYFIKIQGCENCWIWGIETQYANSNHISLNNCEFIEIRGCYIHKSSNYGGGGNGYGIAIGSDAKQCLIEDNVFKNCRHSIVTGGPCHWNVIGYNASYDPISWSTGGLPVWVTGDIQVHGNSGNPGNDHGAYENLFEGNYFNWIWIDAYWGDNGPFNTFFRNTARIGGMVLEDHFESSHGGIHVNCNDSQNIVNNYYRNLELVLSLRYGSPWGCGHLYGDSLGGEYQFARNNKVYKVEYPTQDSVVVFETEGEEPIFLDDISYYHDQKPFFMGALPWPYDAFDTLSRNPAALRYEGGGQVTSSAGWGHYNVTGVAEYAYFYVNIYPNPVNDVLIIEMQDTRCKMQGASRKMQGASRKSQGNLRFEILDLRGRIVMEGLLNDNMRIGVRGLRNGVYVVRISNERETFYSDKIVVSQ